MTQFDAAVPVYIPTLIVGAVTLPPGCVTSNVIQVGANIDAAKLVHQNPGVTCNMQITGPTTNVASVTQTLGMAQAAGTLQAFGAWVEVAGSGGGMSVTVDLQKSTGAGSYTTVLSAVITLNASTVVRTLSPATFTTATYVAGDIFRAVVVATTGGGTLPQGLSIKLVTRENPQ